MLYKKDDKNPTISEFNAILNSLSHTDKIGHLFIVDIKFHNKNEKTMVFNEIYTSIFENNNNNKKKKSRPMKDLLFNLWVSGI